MAALDYDLEIEQGATYRLTIPVLDEDHRPLDVTGWSVRGQIRAHHGSAHVLYDLAARLATAGPTVVLDIPGDDSVAWVWRTGVYDIELVDPGGGSVRLAQGRVVVSPEVTR